MNTPQLILSDLDGTLVDSVPDLAHAVDDMMQRLGLPVRGVEAVTTWVGNGIERLVKRALTADMHAEPDAALFAQAYPVFMECYAACNGRYSQLYPGVLEGLQWLREHCEHLVCVTNKAERFTHPLLENVGIAEFFDLVIGGDTLATKKPDPLQLTHSMRHFQKQPAQSLMLGDSVNDVQAANAAGCQIICVSYGYNHGQDIRLSGAHAVIDSLTQLPALLSPNTTLLKASVT